MRLRNKSPYTLHIGAMVVLPGAESCVPDPAYIRWAKNTPDQLQKLWVEVLEPPADAALTTPTLSRTVDQAPPPAPPKPVKPKKQRKKRSKKS